MIDSQLIVAVSTLLGTVAANGLVFWRLRFEIHSKTAEQTTSLVKKVEETKEAISHDFEQTTQMNQLQIQASNSFNTKHEKTQQQINLIWEQNLKQARLMDIVLKQTGIVIPEGGHQ